jgi:hypothetical protein
MSEKDFIFNGLVRVRIFGNAKFFQSPCKFHLFRCTSPRRVACGNRPVTFWRIALSVHSQRTRVSSLKVRGIEIEKSMNHSQLVEKAVRWLRRYRCGVVLSEQACVSGEMPDAIGWKRACHSVLVECKVTRADFVADWAKPFRVRPEHGVGSERFYLTLPGIVRREELPAGWGLLEVHGREVEMVHSSTKNLRSAIGFRYEMNLLLASLRRVEVRIEPQSITDFLKWKNRMAEYNRGTLPEGLTATEEEINDFLRSDRII